MSRPFASFLGQEMEQFLGFKHAMGHPYERGEGTLRSLDQFIVANALSCGSPSLEDIVFRWLSSRDGRKSVTIANDLGVVRQFCLWRRRRDPASFVPGRQWASQATKSHFSPHIFTEREVQALLEAAGNLHGPPFRPVVIRMMLTILYCTGLRVGEAVRLRLRDVDTRHGIFTVQQSKGKARLVPFGEDLQREVDAYLERRLMVGGDDPDLPLLLRANGNGLTVRSATDTVRRLLRSIGLKPPKGRLGPRTHDLRHTFAVHRLVRWYAEGEDVQALLPWLSTYMGHDNIMGTELYLHATPELMAVAAGRLRAHCFGG